MHNDLTNSILGKPATQSSTHVGLVASFANDGIYPTSDTGGTHTHEEYGPWWRVDMQKTVCVTAVCFLNRGYVPFAAICEYLQNECIFYDHELITTIITTKLHLCKLIDLMRFKHGYIHGRILKDVNIDPRHPMIT